MKRYVLGGGVLLLAMAIGIVAYTPDTVVPPAELARRCAESHPEWPSYQEGVKGKIGAGPTAAWQGEPVAVRATAGGIEVVFAVQPPWSGYDMAMPILIRIPQGLILLSHTVRHEDGQCVYLFPETAANAQTPPAWIELAYPHDSRRITLDAKGTWSASVAG